MMTKIEMLEIQLRACHNVINHLEQNQNDLKNSLRVANNEIDRLQERLNLKCDVLDNAFNQRDYYKGMYETAKELMTATIKHFRAESNYLDHKLNEIE